MRGKTSSAASQPPSKPFIKRPGASSRVRFSADHELPRGVFAHLNQEAHWQLRPCPVCSAIPTSHLGTGYDSGPWKLETCSVCDCTYLANPPPYELIATTFAWEKSAALEEARRCAARPFGKKVSARLTRLRKKLLRRDKILALASLIKSGPCLDLGCGSGSVMARLPYRLIPYGIEISPDLARAAAPIAASRGGLVLATNAIDGLDYFASNFFYGALLSSFLDHEIYPRRLLLELRRTLRPGGIVIVKVANYESLNRLVRGRAWCGFRFPNHVNYFTPWSLSHLAARCGYAVIRCNFFDRWPLSDTLWAVLQA
jgi:SAM-dependent methyltransferase